MTIPEGWGGAAQPVVRRPRWLVAAVAGLGAVAVAALAYAAWLLVAALFESPSAGTPLAAAYEACDEKGVLSDEDRTIDLDMKGEEAGSGSTTVDDLYCYLDELGTPEYVIRQMESTRALDGRQTVQWGAFEATWTYHPDDGLDVLIRFVG